MGSEPKKRIPDPTVVEVGREAAFLHFKPALRQTVQRLHQPTATSHLSAYTVLPDTEAAHQS